MFDFETLWQKDIREKQASKMLMKLTPGVRFHQHFTCAFFTNIWASKITKLCFRFEIFWRQNISDKSAHKMLMKLTPG